MAFVKPTRLPYGGGGHPLTKIIGGHRYYLHNWGPHKPRKQDVDWSKKQTGATHARTVRDGTHWCIYVRA